jgi:hypothetical protein
VDRPAATQSVRVSVRIRFSDRADMHALGEPSLRLLADALGECVPAGIVTTTDLPADAVALWLGLHGLAHQQSVTVSFPWPPTSLNASSSRWRI